MNRDSHSAARCVTLLLSLVAGLSRPVDAQAVAVPDRVETHAATAWEAALDLWRWAEPGYQETRSSKRLAELLESRGFEVEFGIADIPTAFVASFGSGRPIIAILAEFDALPGLSQEAQPTRQPRAETNWGHGCGHHLFGAGSVAGALATADAIDAGDLSGTIRVYGTPAEEGGASKTFLVRDGAFDDVDAALHWHPSDRNAAGDPSNLSRIAAKFRFHGQSAHAAGAPERGRSALDAVELMNHATQLLREHTPELTRIHHVITEGGEAPNVVPNFAEAYYYVRHPDPATARSVYERVVNCAQAGALATGTELEIEYLGGTYNILPNDTLGRVSLRHLRQLADLEYDAEESAFAKRLQESLRAPKPLHSISEVSDTRGEISRGSTDVGDVSWAVPTTGFRTACWVPGTAAHSWQATAAGGTTLGRQGMILAARVLASTAAELMSDPELLQEAQEEHRALRAGRTYESLLEEGQPPPLDYRKPPR